MSENDHLFQFWEKTTQNYQQAFSLWQNMVSASIPDVSSLVSPWKPVLDWLQSGFQEMGQRMLETMSETCQKEWRQKTFGVFQDLDKKALAGLQQMNATNLATSYQKWVEHSTEWIKDAGKSDPKAVLEFWQTMVTEYLKDLEAIPENAKKVDLQHLWELWSKTATNPGEAATQTYVRRFLDSLGVKLKYGLEYYADPEKIRVGQTAKERVWEKGNIQLDYYPAAGGKAQGPPVLIVYSLINRPYILDLLPGTSLIEYFVAQGLDVYLIVWKEPTFEERTLTLDALIEPGIDEVVNLIAQRAGCEKVSLLGHCFGGTLTVAYAACHPEKVARLLTLTTPITAADSGIVGLWARIFPIDPIIDTYGNMPAKLIRYSFIAIKPYYEVIRWKRFYEQLDKMSDESLARHYAVDKWVNDNIDVPGEAFRKFIHEVYEKDRFCKGQTLIHGKPVDLARITCPLFNIVAEEDWIVPPASATVLNDLVGSAEKKLCTLPGQHLSILLDPRSRKVWEEIVVFFKEIKSHAAPT